MPKKSDSTERMLDGIDLAKKMKDKSAKGNADAESKAIASAKVIRKNKKAKLSYEDEEFRTTSMHLPLSQIHLLQDVALKRTRSGGGRMSVSNLVVEILANAESKLKKELE